MDNDTWEIYIYPWSENFTFNWPEILVNDQPMTKIKSDGNVSLPETLEYSKDVCEIIGLKIGTLYNTPITSECQVYKCPHIKELWWKIFIAVSSIILILAIILTNANKGKEVISSCLPESRYCKMKVKNYPSTNV